MAKTTLFSKIRACKGFTLTEAAIFVGISGLVLGAIWAAASAVQRNSLINETIGNVLQITQNMRTLYVTQSTFTNWGTGTNITQAMINAEIPPTKMLNPANPAQLLSAWKTPVNIKVGSALNRFDIEFSAGLPTDICISLAAMVAGTGRDKGLIEIDAGGTVYTTANFSNMTATNINSCTSVTFTFNLKG